jgi:hypothetical protein
VAPGATGQDGLLRERGSLWPCGGPAAG